MATEESSDGGSTRAGSPGDGSDGSAGSGGGGGLPITRRHAIAGGGLVALLGAGFGVAHVLRPTQAVLPTVPEADLEANGWVKVDEAIEPVLKDSAGPVTVEARAGTVQYENEALLTDIRDTPVSIEFLGETITEALGDFLGSTFDQTMGVFAATKIDVTPHVDELPGGLGRAEVMAPVVSQAQAQFEQQLRDAGLENVRQVETGTFDVATGQAARVFEYRADFVFGESSASVRGASVDISGGEIEIAGYLAVWHDGRDVLLAAGAHPNQNYAESLSETIRGQELTIAFDLGLSPTEIIDRTYFRSIYAREPGGVLFEFATLGPGFDVDEPVDRLGERLALPEWLESEREEIEARLPAFEPPRAGDD